MLSLAHGLWAATHCLWASQTSKGENSGRQTGQEKVKFNRATPLLKALLWLPVHQRIHYKVNLLTIKSLHGLAPQYLCDLLHKYQPARSLRSENASLLVVPKTRVKIGERSFAVAAPKLWNELPRHMREIDNLSQYKSSLKTHLFRIAFD